MRLDEKKWINKLLITSTSVYSYFIPIFQYIPCTSIWFGIMSVPLISYLVLFLSYPGIAQTDFIFFFSYGFPWSLFALLSGSFFLYSLIYQLSHRKHLVFRGPYALVRHPQYLGMIMMTFCLTMIAFNTSPINVIAGTSLNRIWIFVIWIIETLLYITLAKIEEFALKHRYKVEFKHYIDLVGFMFPRTKLRSNKD
jgi:protein-S-isoprenylcysteine O-methyltransferase Ste14